MREFEMKENVGTDERIPRVVMALAMATAALWAPKAALKIGLLTLAGGMLGTVATGYCPVYAIADRDTTERPTWRTLKTWRVEASPTSS